MTTVYRCDNCGKEFDNHEKLRKFEIETGEYTEDSNMSYSFPSRYAVKKMLGEYCQDCAEKIEARIKEGVQ